MKIVPNPSKHKKKVIGLMVLLFAIPLSNPIAQTINSKIINQWPDKRYTLHNDGTVTDVRTGLMWKVCSEGQGWSESNGRSACSAVASHYTWKAALEIVNNHTFAGHSDWRVPNLNELVSLVADDRHSPSINSNIFPATPPYFFWSSSPDPIASHGVWIVNFKYGSNASYYRSERTTRVRLVRLGR